MHGGRVAWVYLVAGHGGYWRTSERLPPVTGEPAAWPDVVAVVPARNEAEMLPVTLPALLGQEYPGALSVLVVDDGSSDGTAEVAGRIAAGGPAAAVIRAARRPGRALGGQGLAMAQGLRAAGPAGRYVLFTDADIAWEAHTCAAWWPRPRAPPGPGLADGPAAPATGWERVVVPAFVYFFAQLYPFRRVNAPGSQRPPQRRLHADPPRTLVSGRPGPIPAPSSTTWPWAA